MTPEKYIEQIPEERKAVFQELWNDWIRGST
jgi:hypothetical protein